MAGPPTLLEVNVGMLVRHRTDGTTNEAWGATNGRMRRTTAPSRSANGNQRCAPPVDDDVARENSSSKTAHMGSPTDRYFERSSQ